MSHSFIDPKNDYYNVNDDSDTTQKKIDPVAQLKWLNTPQVYGGWGLFNNQPAQMFAQDEEEQQQKPDEEKLMQGKAEDEELQMKEKPTEKQVSSGTQTSIPNDVRGKMESSFGTDFSGVNIHQNSDQASNIGALAYTQGNDVHFAPGQYNPGSQKGQELLGHELTHVVQQRQGRVKPTKQGKGLPVNDNPTLEKEADVMGAKAAQGKMADVSGKGSGVQMKEEEANENAKGNENSVVCIYEWEQTDDIIGLWHDRDPIIVRNRSIDDWRKFLISDAQTRDGGLELNMYMGIDLYGGDIAWGNSLSRDPATKIRIKKYTEGAGIIKPENLMIALLTVGKDIDLQDSPYEGGGSRISKDSLLKLLNLFTQKYSGQALMKLGTSEFDDENINAFIEASIGDGFNKGAAYFGDEYTYGDIHVKLINGALAAALGHMSSLSGLVEEFPTNKAPEKNTLKWQIKNMGKTVRSAIMAMKNVRDSQLALNLSIFEILITAGTAGLASTISGPIKKAMFAGASAIVKSGLKSLAGNKESEAKIGDYENEFESSFVSILNEIENSDTIDNKGIVALELGQAKLNFLVGLKGD